MNNEFKLVYYLQEEDRPAVEERLIRLIQKYPIYRYEFTYREDMVRRPLQANLYFPIELGDGVPLDILAPRTNLPEPFATNLCRGERALNGFE